MSAKLHDAQQRGFQPRRVPLMRGFSNPTSADMAYDIPTLQEILMAA
jgi:hypothetical protein